MRQGEQRRAYRTLFAAFTGAAKSAGLSPRLRRHDLRHRRATTWLGEGQNGVHVNEAVGHSDLRATMGYTHGVRENLRAIATNAATARSSTPTTAEAPSGERVG